MKQENKITLFIAGGFIVLTLLFIVISVVFDIFGPESEEPLLVNYRRNTSKDSIQTAQRIEKSNQEASKGAVVEVRICIQDAIMIRTGPGENFSRIADTRLVKGGEIFVLDEINRWVKFRVTVKDEGWYGWVKKDLTVPKKHWDLSKYDVGIKKWMKAGLISIINPESSEALVNSTQWNSLDLETKESIGNALIEYCTHHTGSDVNWCDIKDAHSGKRVATYSREKGLQIF